MNPAEKATKVGTSGRRKLNLEGRREMHERMLSVKIGND